MLILLHQETSPGGSVLTNSSPAPHGNQISLITAQLFLQHTSPFSEYKNRVEIVAVMVAQTALRISFFWL